MKRSVLGAMPKIGMNEKKSAAMMMFTNWAISRVTDMARGSSMIERLSYSPAIKNTPSHTIKRRENGSRWAKNSFHAGNVKVRKKSESHSENIKNNRSPTNSPSVL